MAEENIGRKLLDDEELEKLFASMSRETVREIANQHTPINRVPTPKEYDRWGKVCIKFNNEPDNYNNTWMIAAKKSIFDYASYFAKYDVIDWIQKAKNIRVGDIVYIYCGEKLQKIMYKCEVLMLDFSFDDKKFDNYEFWNDKQAYEDSKNKRHFRLRLIGKANTDMLKLSKLQEHGLNGRIQGPRTAPPKLVDYVEKYFNDYYSQGVFPDVSEEYEYHEGHVRTVTVNAYERSSGAREKCIEYHGIACKICGINFGEKYGKLGEGFIHVHHLKPLHKIGKDYVVDHKKDLIPVCPNCHAMIHRIPNGENMSIEEIKEQLQNS